MAREKRKAQRVEFSGRTVVYVGNQQVVCRGGNLSSTGMLLLGPLAAPVGKSLKLVFSLRPSQWVNIEARVVRQAQETGDAAVAWGLEFVRVSGDLAGVLSEYVAERLGLLPEAGVEEREPSRPGTGPAYQAVPAAAAPERTAGKSGGSLFSRLRSRLSEAWSGSEPEPAPRGTSYAMGPQGRPAADRGRLPEPPQPSPVAPTPPRAPTLARSTSAPARRTAPPIDVPPSLDEVPVSEVEDVLPHNDVLGNVDKLQGSDRRLHKLYAAALRDIDRDDED